MRFKLRALAGLAACMTALTVSGASANDFQPDCTDPGVNDYFRTEISRARLGNGDPLAEGVSLSLVGQMRPGTENGDKITCHAQIKVTVRDGSSALRATTVFLTISGGEVQSLDFVMAPNL
ncbi:hypothetical protein [Devosia sediminis]|uniref:Uncharacterized protein n=1 Tax=Devosia sediminis TaxID=2798801 RepID=A0A934MLK2_9HYPH|nr:hypothetical protein [Devosia sediminis]MBJ3785250.1 hypothetical protein [Devosia sediminis]